MRTASELHREPEPTIEELVVSLAKTIEHLCPEVTTAEARPIAEELVLACESLCGAESLKVDFCAPQSSGNAASMNTDRILRQYLRKRPSCPGSAKRT